MSRIIQVFLTIFFPVFCCAQAAKSRKAKAVTQPATFHLGKLPDPIPYLDTYCSGAQVLRSEVSNLDSVQVKYCFKMPSNFRVVHYEISGTSKGQFFKYVCEGWKIGPVVKSLLAKVPIGSKIFIDKIRAIGPDGTRKNFPGLTLFVVDKLDTSNISYKMQHRVPEPDIFAFESKPLSKVSKYDILFMDQLDVKCNCMLPGYSNFEVMSFDLEANMKGNKVIYSGTGPKFTDEMKDVLKSVKSGMKFYIQRVLVRADSNVVGYLSPRTFRVVTQ